MQEQFRISNIILWTMVSASLALMVYNTATYYKDRAEPKEPETEIKTGTNLTGRVLKDVSGKKIPCLIRENICCRF